MTRENVRDLVVTVLVIVSVFGGTILLIGTGAASNTDLHHSDDYRFSTSNGVAFGQSTYTEARGDVVNISVEFGISDNVTVQIGDPDRNGYAITAVVVDENNDGIADIQLNTFEAGAGGTNPDGVVTVSGDDRIKNVQQGGTFTDTHPGTAGADILAPEYYELFVKAGQADDLTADSADDMAALSLTERSTDDMQIWTAPADETVTDTADIDRLVENDSLTRTGSIAGGDTMVISVRANGLEGTFDDTDGYRSIAAAETFFGLSFEEAAGNPNGGTESYSISDFDSGNVTVVYDDTDSSELDTHYVIIDSAALTEMFTDHEAGDEYDAMFRVFAAAGDNDLGTGYESVSDTTSIEERTAEIDTNNDSSVVLQPTSEQTISGETTVAPGTELDLLLRSDGATPAFFTETTPTVTPNRTFRATINLTEASPGDNFTVEVSHGADTISDSYGGYIVRETDPSPIRNELGANSSVTNETDDSSSANVTETPEVTATVGPETDSPLVTTTPVTTTSAEAPGFTAVIGIVALIAAGLLGTRQRE
jgi:PGF-CTERM protein